jgi:hypothetical protein
MIQRKQSIFMLATIACIILSFFFPQGTLGEGELVTMLTPYGLVDQFGVEVGQANSYFFYIPLTLALTVTFIALFNYAKRKAQMRWLQLTTLLLLISIVLQALYIYQTKSTFEALPFSVGLGFILPVIGIVGVILANRFIKKDEELVRSVDRIR